MAGVFAIRRFALTVFLLCFAATAGAQTPEQVLVAKFRSYRQVSASELQPAAGGFGAMIGFRSAVPTTTTVQLRGPTGTLTTLSRNSATEYEALNEFADLAAFNAAFPDGTYTVLVGGTSAATVRIETSMAAPPVLITNFSELQAARAGASIHWQPIQGSTHDDLLSLSISDASGRELFSTPDGYVATQTFAYPGMLPPGQPLTGELVYARLAANITNGGATVVATAVGFAVEFPLRRVEDPPAITSQPRSRAASVGDMVQLTVTTAGEGVSYQWRKDGVVLPQTGPSLLLSPLRGTDAGHYTVELENSAGRVTSEPAVVVVLPEMTFSVYAGQQSQHGTADGPIGAAQFTAVRQMAFDGTGTLFVIDGDAVRKIAGGVVTTIAGSVAQSGYVDGVGTAARFSQPQGIAVDPAGNIFVADTYNARLRKITPTGIVSTVPTPQMPFAGLTIDAGGNLWGRVAADVVRISPAGAVSTVYTGSSVNLQPLARLPMASDRMGNVFASYGPDIVKIAPTGEAAIFAGGKPVNADKTGGLATDVYFAGITSLACDPSGNLYVAGGVKLWMIAPSLATATVADRRSFAALACDPTGTLYAAEGFYASAITRGALTRHSLTSHVLISSAPQAQTVSTGDAVALNVAATGPDLSYQWLRDGAIVPGANDPVLVVREITHPADYSVVVGNGVGAITSPAARVTTTVSSTPGRMINLSLRARAGTGEQTLIMGFAIGGRNTAGNRTMLLRGVGPGLLVFGVGGVLADPRLDVMDASGTPIANNDDWGGDRAVADAASEVGAFQLAPGAKDAALLISLQPRVFTAQISGTGASGGVALAEAYDASTALGPGDSRLINVSARTVAGTGDETLTAGLVIGGTTSKTVLIRAIGPGLNAFGVSGVLPDPKLTLFSESTKIAENDNWTGAVNPDVFSAVGAFALAPYSLDAALVTTLQPGAYTVQVTGGPAAAASGQPTAGVALVELYEVQ